MELKFATIPTASVFLIQNEDDALSASHVLKKSDTVFLDLETTGLNPINSDLLLLTIGDGQNIFVFDYTKLDKSKIARLFSWMTRKTVVAHNASFDVKFMYHYGVPLPNARCTLITESLIYAGIHGMSMSLEETAFRRLNYVLDKQIREEFSSSAVQINEIHIKYAAQDVYVLKPIYELQQSDIRALDLQKVYDLEMSIIYATSLMEYFGIRVDLERLKQAELPFIQARDRAFAVLQDIFISGGCAEEIVFTREGYFCVKPTSSEQLLKAFHCLGINVPSMNAKDLAEYDAKYAEKNINSSEFEEIVDDEELLQMRVGYAHPVLRVHAAASVAQKVLSTYIYGIQERLIGDRIYPSYLQTGARATGRFSSRNPNFQNIVKKDKLERIGLGDWDIRSMFIADEGYTFIICDYSGIELVIAALFSEDEKMLELITSGDIHSYVASHIFGVEVNSENKKKPPYSIFRDCAKTLTYAKMYGAGGYNLERSLAPRLNTVGVQVHPGDGQKWSKIWDEIFPNAGRFLNASSDQAVTRGYVTTILGRRRNWKLPFPSKGAYNAARREGSNAPIQGSSADMMKLTIKMLFERLKFPEERIVATIHDEIIVTCPEERAEEVAHLVGNIMVEAGETLFPLAKKYKAIQAEPKITKRYDK